MKAITRWVALQSCQWSINHSAALHDAHHIRDIKLVNIPSGKQGIAAS